MLGTTSLVKVIRRAASVDWSSGDPVAGVATEFYVTGSVQPMTDRDLQFAPEGVRTREAWKLYADLSEVELVTADVNGPKIADVVEVDGARFVVQSVRIYRHANLGHRKYTLVKPQRDDRTGTV